MKAPLQARPKDVRLDMKILYVMPTQYTSQGILFKQEKAFFPTLTLPYLAGLTPKDIEVEIKNDYKRLH
jgi:hypothetical protein